MSASSETEKKQAMWSGLYFFVRVAEGSPSREARTRCDATFRSEAATVVRAAEVPRAFHIRQHYVKSSCSAVA